MINPSILFDLDGTLSDPKEGIINSILHALDRMGIREDKKDELLGFIGPPLRDSFRTRYGLSEELGNKAVAYYREYFSVKGLFENSLYPDIWDLLSTLSHDKYKLFVATSKPTVYANQIVKYFGLDEFFTDVIGSNLDNSRTDKAEVIAHVLTSHNLDPLASVMIGDRKHDILGAQKNNLRSIGVTYGYGTLDELTVCKPDFVANNCSELLAYLRDQV